MHSKIKNLIGIILVFLLIGLSGATYKSMILLDSANSTVQQANQTIKSVEELIKEAKPKINNSLDHVEKAAGAVEKVSNAQAQLLLNEKTATKIGVLVRKADNLARFIDHIESISEQLDFLTIMKVNNAIDASTKALQSVDSLVISTDKNLNTLSGIAIKDLEYLSQLLRDEKLKSIISNLEQTSSQIKETSKNINITSQEIREAMPELLQKIEKILSNTDQSGEEINKFLQTLNKPQSKKEKVFRFIIESLIKSSPVLLRR